MGFVGQQPAREARLATRSRPLEELIPLRLVGLGLALGTVSLLIYISRGYSHGMLRLWLAGLVVAAVGFGLRARVWPRIAVLDVGLGAAAAAACSPLYLIALSGRALAGAGQLGRDRGHGASRRTTPVLSADPFAYSYYLPGPHGLFVVWGKLGELIGGIDLLHMRLLHGLSDCWRSRACYVLFRLLLPRLGVFSARCSWASTTPCS